MPEFRTKEEAIERCKREGHFLPRAEVNLDKIKFVLKIAVEDLESAEDAKQKKRWNCSYKMYYDALRELVEAFLSFDKIKSVNHQCLFAYLCVNHPELEFNWDFFEKIRTKRNGINYYATPVTKKDLIEIELQTKLYFNLLKKNIENKLREVI